MDTIMMPENSTEQSTNKCEAFKSNGLKIKTEEVQCFPAIYL
jgi:hypothetical protein